MKETGLTGKRRSTTIAATPDDGKSQRKRRRSVVVWVSVDAESICETLEVLRSGYNRHPVTIDIGHQSQDNYHCSDEPSRISFCVFLGTMRRLVRSFLRSYCPVMR